MVLVERPPPPKRPSRCVSGLRENLGYLQKDGASRDTELDTVLGSVVPGQQLQVLYGTVGQRRLHVAGGLQERQKRRTSSHCLY